MLLFIASLTVEELSMNLQERLAQWKGKTVVVDLASPYVAVGVLTDVGDHLVELRDADMHDLRDSETTRENYLVKTARHGVVSNRKVVILRTAEIVGLSRLSDLNPG